MNKEEKLLTGYPHIDKPWMKWYDSEFFNKEMPKMGIYDYMKNKTLPYKNNTAISYFGKEIIYDELYNNIDNASRVLSQLGVAQNDRIMYLMPNIPETAYLMYGGSQIGAISDYIDPRPDSVDLNVSAKKVLSLIIEEKIDYIIALDQCYLGMLKPIESELKNLGIKNIILVSAKDSMNLKSTINYLNETRQFNGLKNLKLQLEKTKRMSELLKNAKQNSQLELLNYSELVSDCKNLGINMVDYIPNKTDIIVHTSGTSSSMPKPIPLTNDNLNAYAHQTFGANMTMEVGDKALHVLPYFAAFGVVDVVHAGLCHGNNLIQVPEFSPSNLGNLISKYKPQTVIGTPTWFLSMIDDKKLQKSNLSFLKMITYGGDSMEIADEIKINEFLKSHGCNSILTKGHGMSETCGCASYAIGEYNKPGSIGIPMPNTIYAIVNPETKELIKFDDDMDYIEGELIISSDTVTPGILDNKVIVPHVRYDGKDYILTRDIVKMDRNGIMYFLSRSDRSFTRYDGFKIKPYEIENVIKTDKNIKYCVISPYNDLEKYGNMPLANIVLNEELMSEEAKVEYVRKIINELFISNPSVSSRQIPSKFKFRTDMPITKNGKINYNALVSEGITGDEVSVELEETNISIGSIKVIPPLNNKKKVLKKN